MGTALQARRVLLHLVAHASPDRLPFHTWAEGRALWDRVESAASADQPLVRMPDHLLRAADVLDPPPRVVCVAGARLPD